MKRLFFITIICLLVVAMATSCGSFGTSTASSSRISGSLDMPLLDYSTKSGFPTAIKQQSDFELKTEQTEYSPTVEEIQFTIYNRSDNGTLFGEPYALEVFRENAWYSVPFKKLAGNVSRAWSAIGYILPAQGSGSGSIHLTDHERLTPGEYRLVKEITTQERENKLNIYVCATFSIREK
jgi:hypothetical protein